jgi:ABC-type branched-subunit amino acid transport system ATPase component
VLENVMIGAGIDLRRRRTGSIGAGRAAHAALGERSREALAAVGIDQHADRSPSELPYGHRRRVEVARAIAMRPRLLLLDEPAAGMTPVERTELGDVITNLTSRGITTVLVEHDFAMIGRVCPRVVVLDAGRCIADGVPAEVALVPEVQEAYLGRTHTAVADA